MPIIKLMTLPHYAYTLVDLISTFDTDFGRITLGIDNLLNEDYQPLVSQMNKEVVWEKYHNQFSGYGRRIALEYSVTTSCIRLKYIK